MKKRSLFIVLGMILAVTIPIGIYVLQNRNMQNRSLGRVCPDQWYDNRMPGPDRNSSQSQYLIINGERKEVKDYDLNWIRENCSVNNPNPVY